MAPVDRMNDREDLAADAGYIPAQIDRREAADSNIEASQRQAARVQEQLLRIGAMSRSCGPADVVQHET